MDVVYRNSEKNMGCDLKRHKRYWEKFGELYGKQKNLVMLADRIIFGMKDILWKIMYR